MMATRQFALYKFVLRNFLQQLLCSPLCIKSIDDYYYVTLTIYNVI